MVDDKEQAIETVLTTLKEILPNEKRRIGQNILPGHKGNFLITGKSDDGSDVTAIFYGENKLKETLILHKSIILLCLHYSIYQFRFISYFL